VTATSRPIVVAVIEQHAEEASFLRNSRSALVGAPQVRLRELGKLDERLEAHLDGLAVAGEHAMQLCDASLEAPSVGTVFTATVRAVQEKDARRIDRLFAAVETLPDTRVGLASALGWVSAEQLRGLVVTLLASEQPVKRLVGVAACAMHRVDPGIVTGRKTVDPSHEVRARALRTLGELGLIDGMAFCASGLADTDPECKFWAAWSATLLGDVVAARAMTSAAIVDGPRRNRAFRLALQAMSTGAAHGFLKSLASDPAQLRWLIQGSGIAGDPTYIPWLINHMREDGTARLAGEAFSMITGLDLPAATLDRSRPEGFESGPSDDPDDANVEMDPDDGLPWPDADKAEKWWSANASRFRKGTRYFMGAPVTREHCVDVLKNGYQRERILAAHYLCLLDPGTPLFNTSAPAWRQQRHLARL
jgi:uncharacterized protein (TIGR02270 family)